MVEPHPNGNGATYADLGGFILDIVAKEYARLPEKREQRFADMEERNERRLNEIENAMIREQRLQFKELRDDNSDLKNAVAAAKRKANGSAARP